MRGTTRAVSHWFSGAISNVCDGAEASRLRGLGAYERLVARTALRRFSGAIFKRQRVDFSARTARLCARKLSLASNSSHEPSTIDPAQEKAAARPRATGRLSTLAGT
jgi:hypothetical protein